MEEEPDGLRIAGSGLRGGVADPCGDHRLAMAAAVRTSAKKVDGGWRVTGQKVWTSGAADADYGLLLARTGGPGHAGLSAFVVAMVSFMEAASSAKEALGGAADHAAAGMRGVGDQVGSVGRKAARTFEDILHEEPLIIGALGLAVGVAVGAALPSTVLEDRSFGAARDDLVEAALSILDG